MKKKEEMKSSNEIQMNETQRILLHKELTRKSTKRWKRTTDCFVQLNSFSIDYNKINNEWKIQLKNISQQIRIVGIHQSDNEINNQFLSLRYVNNGTVEFIINQKGCYHICGYIDSFENKAFGIIEI